MNIVSELKWTGTYEMKIDSEILINCQNSDEENDDNGTELRITDLT